MEKESIFDFLDEVHQTQSISLESKAETESPKFKESIIPNERTAFLLFPFFIELIDQFKESLKNLKNFTRIFQEKFRDKEFGEYFNRMIGDDITKIELVQNSLLNYIKINNPIIKTDTVNTLLEEELKKYQVELEEKEIKLFKKLEKNLPETAVPDDQLRYILSCVLQYVIALIPPSVSFGLFTRSFTHQREKGDDETLVRKERKYVEILMVYTGYKKPLDRLGSASGIPARQKEGILDLTLRLVDEIVQRNRGMMKFAEDEKKEKTTVSLRFPVERRKVVYYQPANDLSSSHRQSKTTFERLSSLEEMRKRD
jgi:uncharacterized protein YeeX (DUF496 family)